MGALPNPTPCAWGHGLGRTEARSVSRRRVALLIGALATLPLPALRALGPGDADAAVPPGGGTGLVTPAEAQALFDEAMASVAPEAGFRSRIALRDSVVKSVENGVIDPEKFIAANERYAVPAKTFEEALGPYPDGTMAGHRVRMPADMQYVLRWPSLAPLRLTRENAGYLLNFLWPVGLANRMAANESSPVNGELLPRFASTAGWTLGKEKNGAGYFNRFPIIELNEDQEEAVVSIALNTFRPCCNNSTFFQDCNHGSAMLGLIELGVAQGLSEQELYQEVLAFNSFWFSDHYALTALYYKVTRGIEWVDVDPRVVLGFDFSAISRWRDRVRAPLADLLGSMPGSTGAARCSA